jgi:hypothetical protein
MFTDGPLAEKMREFEVCYLDNTYLHESFDKIPSRAEALKEIIEHIEHVRIVQDNTAIFFIKMKLLGKEEMAAELYKHFCIPLVCSGVRYKRYTNILGLGKNMLMTEPSCDSFLFLEDNELYENQKVIEFCITKTVYTIEPTALHLKQKRNPKEKYVKIPYTDHSSFSEIKEFILNLKPKRIIPIVRKALPNNIITTDIKCLSKLQSKRPPLKTSIVNETYKLLLKSTSSVRRGLASLNSFHLNKPAKHTDTPNLSKTVSRIGLEMTSTPNKQSFMNQHVNDLTPIHLKVDTTRVTRTRGKKKKTEIEYEDSEEIDLDILLNTEKNKKQMTDKNKDSSYKVVKVPLISTKKIPGIYKLKNIKVR